MHSQHQSSSVDSGTPDIIEEIATLILNYLTELDPADVDSQIERLHELLKRLPRPSKVTRQRQTRQYTPVNPPPNPPSVPSDTERESSPVESSDSDAEDKASPPALLPAILPATHFSDKKANKREHQSEDEPPLKRRRVPDFQMAIRTTQRESQGVAPLLGPASAFVQIQNEVLSRLREAQPKDTVDINIVNRHIVYFVKVFGKQGLSRIAAFLALLRSTTSTWLPEGSPTDPANPQISTHPLAREVIYAYNKQRTSRASAIVSKPLRYSDVATFYRRYEQLTTEALEPRSKLRAILKQLGLTTSRGRSWASVVQDYLLYCLDGQLPGSRDDADNKMFRARFKNEVALGQSYNQLYSTWGDGIFALLPEQDINSFKKWKGDHLRIITQCLVDILPVSRDVCEVLDRTIVQPIRKGQQPVALLIEQKSAIRQKLPLLEMVSTDPANSTE